MLDGDKCKLQMSYFDIDKQRVPITNEEGFQEALFTAQSQEDKSVRLELENREMYKARQLASTPAVAKIAPMVSRMCLSDPRPLVTSAVVGRKSFVDMIVAFADMVQQPLALRVSTISFSFLEKLIRDVLGNRAHGQHLHITYRDSENDIITVRCDLDIYEAVRCTFNLAELKLTVELQPLSASECQQLRAHATAAFDNATALLNRLRLLGITMPAMIPQEIVSEADRLKQRAERYASRVLPVKARLQSLTLETWHATLQLSGVSRLSFAALQAALQQATYTKAVAMGLPSFAPQFAIHYVNSAVEDVCISSDSDLQLAVCDAIEGNGILLLQVALSQ
eukprot:TRINITY_DN1177_c0_g1_i1.p1 TRINITY_DN1177_c0_g1~~TRINITY_DN1177_c0_g1_i1.p1  ORF type:complete len:338 (+),score=80.52 TRINITY_DN1177_c0_g1_i1:443-1456(+)